MVLYIWHNKLDHEINVTVTYIYFFGRNVVLHTDSKSQSIILGQKMFCVEVLQPSQQLRPC